MLRPLLQGFQREACQAVQSGNRSWSRCAIKKVSFRNASEGGRLRRTSRTRGEKESQRPATTSLKLLAIHDLPESQRPSEPMKQSPPCSLSTQKLLIPLQKVDNYLTNVNYIIIMLTSSENRHDYNRKVYSAKRQFQSLYPRAIPTKGAVL